MFMLRTNLTTRRTFVRLRASPDKSEALSGLGLSVLHLFFLSPKRGCKKTCRFLQPLNFFIQADKLGTSSRVACITVALIFYKAL